MPNGLFLIRYTGQGGDFGSATLAFINGEVFGVDVAGVEYYGRYNDQNENCSGEVTLTVPAGVALVTGAPPMNQQYQFSIPFSLPSNMNEKQTVQLRMQLPTGPVNANITKVKNLAI